MSGVVTAKRLLNCAVTDPNQILPIKYTWAREHYETGVANTWVPQEVNMQRDVETWRDPTALSDDERRVVLWNLGFFSTGESLTANNLVLALYRHITNPECRQYLLRQAFEEAIHTDAFIHVCDALALEPSDVYGMYRRIPGIQDKDEFVVARTESILDPTFSTTTHTGKAKLVENLIAFYLVMEGIFFYAGFAMMLSFLRRDKMTGVGEQFWFILRDESVHVSFGTRLIRTILEENPSIRTSSFEKRARDDVLTAVDLELAYARDCLPKGILGLSSETVGQYLRYVADRRLSQIGLRKEFGVPNPLTWMSELTDLGKEKFIFEKRVGDYRHASALEWR